MAYRVRRSAPYSLIAEVKAFCCRQFDYTTLPVGLAIKVALVGKQPGQPADRAPVATVDALPQYYDRLVHLARVPAQDH